MIPRHRLRLTHSLVAAALANPLAGAAATLDPGGRGQALIYPYYTVQSAGGNAFNTYISVVNHSRDSDKALRVRFRESRNGREVASLNLYLGRNDVWTAALVPDGDGARLITRDASCTEPAIWTGQGVAAAQDAISAVLMKREAAAEWTREEVTASQTDFLFTFPTRPHYLQAPVSLPFLAIRTLRNGTLSCSSGDCQGNYGSAFPYTYRREITSP